MVWIQSQYLDQRGNAPSLVVDHIAYFNGRHYLLGSRLSRYETRVICGAKTGRQSVSGLVSWRPEWHKNTVAVGSTAQGLDSSSWRQLDQWTRICALGLWARACPRKYRCKRLASQSHSRHDAQRFDSFSEANCHRAFRRHRNRSQLVDCHTFQTYFQCLAVDLYSFQDVGSRWTLSIQIAIAGNLCQKVESWYFCANVGRTFYDSLGLRHALRVPEWFHNEESRDGKSHSSMECHWPFQNWSGYRWHLLQSAEC